MRKRPSQDVSKSKDLGSVTTAGSMSEKNYPRRTTSRAIINCQALGKVREVLTDSWEKGERIEAGRRELSVEDDDSLLQELVDMMDARPHAHLKPRSVMHSPRQAPSFSPLIEATPRPTEVPRRSMRKVKSVKLIFKGHGAVTRRREIQYQD